MTGAFARYGAHLLKGGYSPVPIRPGSKRPLLDNWDCLRKVPMRPFEIERLIKGYRYLGLGVAGGFNGLVIIDFDTDDKRIIDAAVAVLPMAVVAKAGRRGFTVFYRGNVPSKKFKSASGKMLIEVITTGQSVIPPSIHPDTKQPYRWLTLKTLLNTRVDQLTEITVADLAALEAALAEWLPAKATYERSTRSASSSNENGGGQARYARSVLDARCRELRTMPKDSGRNVALFAAVCRLGRWVHNRIISMDEMRDDLVDACKANGLVRDDGMKAVLATITSGMRMSAGDSLPTLEPLSTARSATSREARL